MSSGQPSRLDTADAEVKVPSAENQELSDYELLCLACRQQFRFVFFVVFCLFFLFQEAVHSGSVFSSRL